MKARPRGGPRRRLLVQLADRLLSPSISRAPGGLTGTVRRRDSAGGACHQATLAALRADAILPDEPAGASDSRRRAVTCRRIDSNGATEATLAEEAASVGQQERRNLVSRDHRRWPGTAGTAPPGSGRRAAQLYRQPPPLGRTICIRVLSRRRHRSRPGRARRKGVPSVDRTRPRGQTLELDLSPRAHEEVVAGILGRASAHEQHVASHDGPRKARPGRERRSRPGAGDATPPQRGLTRRRSETAGPTTSSGTTRTAVMTTAKPICAWIPLLSKRLLSDLATSLRRLSIADGTRSRISVASGRPMSP